MPINPKTLAKRDAKLQVQFLETFKRAKTITGALKSLGMDYSVYKRWFENYPEFEEKISQMQYEFNDLVESILWKHISNDNLTAAIFWLKHRSPEFKTRTHIYSEPRMSRELTEGEKEQVKRAIRNLE